MKGTPFLQMVLTREMLTKPLKNQRKTAISLLTQLTNAGKLPALIFEFSMGGTPKRASHFCKVKFRIPQFILDSKLPNGEEVTLLMNSVVGSGRCKQKASAKSLAALEVILRLEEEMNVPNGYLLEKLENLINEQKEKQKELEAVPVTQEVPGVSFDNIPFDMSFKENDPAGRLGNIDFVAEIKADRKAFLAAKAITLTSQNGPPTIETHVNNVQDAPAQKYTNIKAEGRISGVVGPGKNETSYDLDPLGATIQALQRIADNLMKRLGMSESFRAFMKAAAKQDSSFGMAKLFVALPGYQFNDLNLLIAKAKPYSPELFQSSTGSNEEPVQSKTERAPSTEEERQRKLMLEQRIATLRKFQERTSLPVDKVEPLIYDNHCSVTIIRGGTGSGKTTRYPLMLSLFSPMGDRTKVAVSQPRRIACQTAANRVAFEQGCVIGTPNSSIGYAIRFESKLSSLDMIRTVDFMTPGLMLRRATNDPLFANYTHLCIDEIHERNADMDLLLALGKKAMRSRMKHPTLKPLQLVLMSATLDIDQWEKYFRDDDPDITIKVIDVPEVRRFDIETIHLGESRFPIQQNSVNNLLYQRKSGEGFDEALCSVAAEVIAHLIRERKVLKNSLLCFLPGLEEIRIVHNMLNGQVNMKNGPRVVYLHSSVSSQDQARAFEPGPKIILATNIAETSITIPDVQIVVDSGRERQASLFESASETETVTVVGSQLVTVNISKASAKQRMGRSGRVMAGTCYRLYTRAEFEAMESFATPEMLRMELSQLVLHSISLYNPKEEHPLCLLLTAPDPPTEQRLQQTLRSLAFQGLVDVRDDECFENFTMTRNVDGENQQEEGTINLTPLGRAVCTLPISPRLGRMLFLGLVLRAIDPAVTIAALLSVPKAFSPPPRHLRDRDEQENAGSSDIVARMDDLEKYLHLPSQEQRQHPMRAVYSQVMRVRQQIEQAMKSYIERNSKSSDEVNWNANSNRVAAKVGLICCATPFIAHLTNGRSEFATRDLPGTAKIHPSSLNFSFKKRAHWYVYNELRVTKEPYLMVTTAASPLDLALFTDASSRSEEFDGVDVLEDFYSDNDWLFVADQWVPVVTKSPSQRQAIRKLRRLLTYDMLQYVSIDPVRFASGELYEHIVLFALSAIERQRIKK